MKAFWFCKEDCKLGYNDGRSVRVGATHKVKGELELCANGLHASERLIDTLRHAPGPILYLVELSGEILRGEDKVCARKRKYVASFNAEHLLRRFARKQALIHIEKIKPYTDQYDLIVSYLETGDESIRSAAESAARLAAWSAARLAARLAARSAAWSAAQSAAESAARLAAWSAVESAVESAAWSAAWSAAQSAAESAANEMLTQMVREETGWDI